MAFTVLLTVTLMLIFPLLLKPLNYYSKFDVFQIRTRAVSCKQMTMVSPVQLLLFSSRSVNLVDGAVELDGW